MEEEKQALVKKVTKATEIKKGKKKTKPKVKIEKKTTASDENIYVDEGEIPTEITQKHTLKTDMNTVSNDVVAIDRLQEMHNEEEREFEKERRHLYEPKNDNNYQKKIKSTEDDLTKCIHKAKNRLNNNMNYNSLVYQKNMVKTNERVNEKNAVTIANNNEKLLKPTKLKSEFHQKASCMMLSHGYSSYQVESDMMYNSKPGNHPNYEQRFREENLPNRLRSTVNNHYR